MLSIKNILGNRIYEITLQDDNKAFGGTSFEGETLDNFMAETNIDVDDSVGKLQETLKKCGIREIYEIDSNVQELIEQKIWDIEEELGIVFDYYSWDYKEYNCVKYIEDF